MAVDLDIRLLRAVVAVADHQSFRRAAESLGLAQSSLSRSVQDVERRTQITVFDRSKRRITVTTDGEQVVRLARKVVGEMDAAQRELNGYRAGQRGEVVIAALPSLAATVLPRAMARMRRQAPDVTVHIRDVPAEEVERLVSDGSADLGLSVAPWDEHPALATTPLLADQMGCAFPRSHRFAGREELPWAELSGEPTVQFRLGTSIADQVNHAIHLSGARPTEVASVGTVGTAGALVALEVGVTVVPALVLPLMAFAEVDWVPLTDPVVEREVLLMANVDRKITPAAARLLAALRHPETRILHPGLRWLD